MPSKFSVFLVCELLHKIYLQVISHDTCLYLMYYFPYFPPCCWERFLHYSLWSRSSLSFPLSMGNLASSLSWLLSVLGALGNVEVPVSSPVEEVSSAYRARRGCAWLIALFFFSFPSNLGTFVQVGHFIATNTSGTFPLSGTTPAVTVHKSNIDNPSLPLAWGDASLPFEPLVSNHKRCRPGSGAVFLSCLIVNVWLRFPSWNWPKLVSETSNRFQFSLEYLPQPISWVLVSWTAPRPSEHSSSGSGGFSVAVMRRVHKAAALTHSPLCNGAQGALVKPAFRSCPFECHVPEERPRASVIGLLPPETSLATNVDPCQIAVFEAAVIFRVGLRAWKIPGTEEPGRLQSMGLQRIGHDLAISLSLWEGSCSRDPH